MRKIRSFLVGLLACGLLMLLTSTAVASSTQVDAVIDDTAAYLQRIVATPQVGSIGGEWAVLGLARSEYAVEPSYFDNYYATIVEYVKHHNGVLHDKKYTEYSRVIMALTAIGRDPSNVGGYNLLLPLGDYEQTIWQGINGPVFALLALDCGNYQIPHNAQATTQATRELYLAEILSRQLADGGFSLTGVGGGTTDADPDITAMVLQALAKYQQRPEVETCIARALVCLSQMQDADGGFSSWGTSNSESIAQVIVALCELGVPLEDPRFVKNDRTLLDKLLQYYQPGQGFTHTGTDSNLMATEQALYALVDVQRTNNGRSTLYDMSDVKQQTQNTIFSDISSQRSRAAIEALAGKGIIAGYSDGTFGPERGITRAEFAAIVVRALALPLNNTQLFNDVSTEKWYAGYVGAACTSGIVQGSSKGCFIPEATITYQEAAVMIQRAARVCGVDDGLTGAQVGELVEQLTIANTVADWAREAVAFCLHTGIIGPTDVPASFSNNITRGEMAQILYNLLNKAQRL